MATNPTNEDKAKVEVHATDSDDPEFIKLVSNLIDGFTAGGEINALHLIHIDNWFDHKWLKFSGKIFGAHGVRQRDERLTVPAFNPNRVLSHQYFARMASDSTLREEPPPTEIHLELRSCDNLHRRVSGIARRASLVWYTSNTRVNRKGAVMAYAPTESAYYTWYASLAANPTWAVEKTKQISKGAVDALIASARLE